MAKATTNGVVPMGIVAVKEEIYDTVLNESSAKPDGTPELFHGYTYSGIPVAVAAALAVQDIIDKEDIFKRAKEMSPYFQDGLHSLKDIKDVVGIRSYGMLGGVEMKMKEKPGKAGFQTFKHCYDAGVNFKNTGDTLIIRDGSTAELSSYEITSIDSSTHVTSSSEGYFILTVQHSFGYDNTFTSGELVYYFRGVTSSSIIDLIDVVIIYF